MSDDNLDNHVMMMNTIDISYTTSGVVLRFNDKELPPLSIEESVLVVCTLKDLLDQEGIMDYTSEIVHSEIIRKEEE